jgi:hypothetical protein
MSMLKKKGVELRKYITRKGLFIRIPIPKRLKELEPEIALGRAILDKAVLDSLDDEATFDWFDINNPDFNTICYIAYLDPQQVEERFITTYNRLVENDLIEDIIRE